MAYNDRSTSKDFAVDELDDDVFGNDDVEIAAVPRILIQRLKMSNWRRFINESTADRLKACSYRRFDRNKLSTSCSSRRSGTLT